QRQSAGPVRRCGQAQVRQEYHPGQSVPERAKGRVGTELVVSASALRQRWRRGPISSGHERQGVIMLLRALILTLLAACLPITLQAENWPQFRGPNGK